MEAARRAAEAGGGGARRLAPDGPLRLQRERGRLFVVGSPDGSFGVRFPVPTEAEGRRMIAALRGDPGARAAR